MRILSLIMLVGIMAFVHIGYAYAFSFNSPLVDAADRGNKAEVLSLLQSGAQPDSKGDFGVTPLMRAAFRGNVEIAKILIDAGAFIDATDVGGETPLHLAARNGDVKMVKLLLDYDAFVDVPDKEKWTPLMRATAAKQPEVVALLLEKGADVTAKNEIGESVIVQAAMVSKSDIMEMLLGDKDFSKIPEEQKLEAVKVAEKRGNEGIGRMLSSAMDKAKEKVIGSEGEEGEVYPDGAEIVIKPLEVEETSDKTAESQPVITKTEGKLPSGRSKISESSEKPAWEKAEKEPVKEDIVVKETAKGVFDPSAQPEKYGAAAKSSPSIKKAETKATAVAASVKSSPAKPVSTQQPAEGKFYAIQLGSFANEGEASSLWSELKDKNPDILSSLEPDILPAIAKNGQAMDYKLNSGRFKWRDVAEASCSSLRTRNIDCRVIKSSEEEYQLAKSLTAGRQEDVTIAESVEEPVAAPSSYKPVSSPDVASSTAAKAINYPSVADSAEHEEPLPWLQQADKSVPPQYPQNSSQPIDLADKNAGYTPPASQAAASPTQQLNNEQLREMARRDYLDQQGMSVPAQQGRDYSQFYNEAQSAPRSTSVSEAILVQDNKVAGAEYSAPMQYGNWLQIDGFPTAEAANDYGTRMFKNDESLRNVNLNIGRSGNGFSMQAGPIDYNIGSNLCRSIMAGGYNCVVQGSAPAQQPQAQPQYAQQASPFGAAPVAPQPSEPMVFWINLGTFANKAEAEYYWMFLREDNDDLLARLKYDMASAGGHGAFGADAVQLKAGPFGQKGRADQICNIMKYRNIACLVQ